MAHTLCRKRRNLLCFAVECGIKTKSRHGTQTKKKVNRKQIQCAIKKKLKNRCEIYGMLYAFRELIVYRICAPARKHVNQLSSTRFPNAIKKKWNVQSPKKNTSSAAW